MHRYIVAGAAALTLGGLVASIVTFARPPDTQKENELWEDIQQTPDERKEIQSAAGHQVLAKKFFSSAGPCENVLISAHEAIDKGEKQRVLLIDGECKLPGTDSKSLPVSAKWDDKNGYQQGRFVTSQKKGNTVEQIPAKTVAKAAKETVKEAIKKPEN